MNRTRLTISIAAPLLLACCAAVQPDLRSATLRCGDARDGGGFIGLYSFRDGGLQPVTAAAEVDLVYYFDADDCFRGALLGRDDHRGSLFLVGRRPWGELLQLDPPAGDEEAVAAIAPLTLQQQGLAFWVETAASGYVLARIRVVREATHTELAAGGIAALELEWLRPRTVLAAD